MLHPGSGGVGLRALLGASVSPPYTWCRTLFALCPSREFTPCFAESGLPVLSALLRCPHPTLRAAGAGGGGEAGEAHPHATEVNVLRLHFRHGGVHHHLPAALRRSSLLVSMGHGLLTGAPNSCSPCWTLVSLLKQVTSLDQACFLTCQASPQGWFGLSGQRGSLQLWSGTGSAPTEGVLIMLVHHLLGWPPGL